MSAVFEKLALYWTYPIVRYALIVGVLIALCSSLLGVMRMFNIGLEWGKRYEAYKRTVELVSDGYHLVGEYFDFGGTSAVLIVAGRTECLLYSYYFAEPFRKAGRNVLVIDNRSHGLSEGRVSSLGHKEYRDLLAWARLLHDELGNETVLLHGVCIGASAALFALTSPDCPAYLEGMIADGMYYNFYKSFENHMKADRPHTVRFPVMQLVMLWIRLFSGADVVFDGPFKRIGALQKPILFLYSREARKFGGFIFLYYFCIGFQNQCASLSHHCAN